MIHGRPGEQGSAMLVVATILTALLAGGGVALFLQLQSTKSVGLTRSGRSSLYCAEAGLAQAKAVFTNQSALWGELTDGDPDNDPDWYPHSDDIDGDGEDDYEASLRDNDDDPTTPVGSQVFLVVKCIQNPEVPRTIIMLMDVAASGHNYRAQSGGGAGNTGNQN